MSQGKVVTGPPPLDELELLEPPEELEEPAPPEELDEPASRAGPASTAELELPVPELELPAVPPPPEELELPAEPELPELPELLVEPPLPELLPAPELLLLSVPPLELLPGFPASGVPDEEKDPQATATAPRDTAMDTDTRERVFFIATSPGALVTR